MSELARRYAEALYEVAPDEESLRITAQALMADGTLWECLCSPAVQPWEKARVLSRLPALDGRGLLLNFYRLLAEKGRLTCVRRPGEEELEKLKKALCKLHKKKDIVFDIQIDPSLVGGFTLELEGVTYDKSVRGALSGLKRQLEERRMA